MEISQSAINDAKLQQAHREKLLDNLAKIEAIQQPVKRYRAIKDFLFKINPKVKAVDEAFCANLTATRNNQLNEFGASKAGDIRQLLDMPVYMYEVLILADSEFNYNVNLSHDPDLAKKTWRKVAEAFPEYRIAHSI